MRIPTAIKSIMSRRPRLWAGLIFLAALLVYSWTASPGVGPIDSAELSLVARTLGIAHPTGYPFYTVLGRTWVMPMPAGIDLAGSLNILSSIVMAMAAALLFLLLQELGVAYLAAAAGALLWAFAPLVWEQATMLEVYGLGSFFGVLLLWLSSRYRNKGDIRFLLLIGFIAGLGLGNHLTLLWYLPGCLILILSRAWKEARGGLLYMAVFFLLGLSIYVFLPLRSRLDPLLNWGDPSNWERMINHLTGRQYRVWMLKNGWPEIAANIRRFLLEVIRQPTIYLSWLALAGMFGLWLRDRMVLLAAASLFVFSAAYAVNYSIPDISTYYLPALAATAILSGFGLDILGNKTGLLLPHKEKKIAYLIFLLPLLALWWNFRDADRHGDNFTTCYASDVLLSAAPNAVIITGNWDLYAPCLYLLLEHGYRPDLALVDKELLRRRWYFRYLERRHPDLVNSCRPEIDAYLPLLERFEKGLPYDAGEIQSRYIALLNALLLRNYYDRPPYMGESSDKGDYAQIAPSCQLIPDGLLFRVRLPGPYQINGFDSLFSQPARVRDTVKLSQREKVLYKNYPRMLYQKGVYLAQALCYEQSLQYFRRALEYDPDRPAVYLGIGGAYMGLNQVEAAVESFRKALILDPDNETARENLEKLRIFIKPGS
jgi:tetratricopeptide (TPR) repeat protein